MNRGLGAAVLTMTTLISPACEREVRPFRIYDGPSEVHRWSIARRAVRARQRAAES